MMTNLDYEPPVPRRRKRRFSWLILSVFIVCLSIAGMGLARVSTTNEIASVGRKHRTLEREIAELEQASNNADLDISEAMSRPDVKERLMQGRTRLKRINPKEIVYLEVEQTRKSAAPDR